MMHDEVVSRLRHLLTEGEIAPGARIPERELCASLSISRTPLREALKVLAAEGLVVLLPNRGSRAAKLTQKDVKERGHQVPEATWERRYPRQNCSSSISPSTTKSRLV